MSVFLRKYGTGSGADVFIPLIKRGVVDFAVGADWTPAAGDVKVSKDGGAAANIATLPTALAMGNAALWQFVFSDAELQCKKLKVTVADSATKAVEDQSILIETFGHASALYPTDYSVANLTADVKAINGVVGSAQALERSASTIYRGTVTGATTTSTLVDSGLTQTDTDFWRGRVIIFTSGALAGQASVITGFTPGSDALAFVAMTAAASGGDTYVIV